MTTFSEVIIDGDQMLYSCGFASEGEPRAHTMRLLKNKMNQILKDCGTEKYQLFIEGKGNFREEISFDYKANRTSEKPESFEDMRQYLIDVWEATPVLGMETDDRVSIELWKDFEANGKDGSKVLSSPDKDLKNTPGWHYNPRTREVFFVSTKQAHRHFCYQLLAGDRVDNIKGLPYVPRVIREEYGLSRATAKGCGDKSASKIIKEAVADPLDDVMKCYVQWAIEEDMSADQSYEYFNEQWQLLWMVREYDEMDEPKMSYAPEKYYEIYEDIEYGE